MTFSVCLALSLTVTAVIVNIVLWSLLYITNHNLRGISDSLPTYYVLSTLFFSLLSSRFSSPFFLFFLFGLLGLFHHKLTYNICLALPTSCGWHKKTRNNYLLNYHHIQKARLGSGFNTCMLRYVKLLTFPYFRLHTAFCKC